jgi:GNAT superfamily N-acetyltransferase
MQPMLRPAAPEDYPAFVRLFPELRVEDPVPSSERWMADLMPSTTVAERAGVVVGYSYHQLLGDSAYVRNLVVDPSARRAGVGRALMEWIRAEARAAGRRRWQLNVMADNAPAFGLYLSLGLREQYLSLTLRFTWSLLARLPPGPPGAIARELHPHRDALVEATFALPAGLIAEARTHGRHLLLEVADKGSEAPRAVARYSPSVPGAFPFRLADPTLARPLLELMQRHALPGLDHTRVVAENDEPLARLLVAAGAEQRERVLHFEGPL